METIKEVNINVDAICILKLAPNSDLVVVDYEPIDKPLESEFEQLIEQLNKDYTDAKDILNFIQNHYKLKVLLEKYNFCQKLTSPYQGLFLDLKEIKALYPSIFRNPSTKDELRKKEKQKLLLDLKDRLQAFYLESTYKVIEEKRKDKQVLAYSHRRVGWSTPKYELNSNFSIEVKTNFGYGSVSYFYTRINFKGLDIIALSDWIKYKYATLYEIIRYSAKFPVSNDSWLEALEYSKDACNLSQTDEIGFIEKYIVNECKSMVSGLQDILENKEFKFLNWERIYTDVHMEGHNLIEFRGEKISGALDFIEKILQFEEIAEIKDFISQIEYCNSQVQPMLENEAYLIQQELVKLRKDLATLKPIVIKLERKNFDFERRKIKFKEQILKNEFVFKYSEFEKRFNELNPEYELFLIEFNQKLEEYQALKAQILSLETTKTNIESYNNKTKKYFKNKQELVINEKNLA